MKNRIIKYTGSLIALLSVVYVGSVFAKVEWGAVLTSFTLYWIPLIAALIAGYMAVNFIRALNWTLIIDYLGNSGRYNKKLILIYLKTEVAKYIPSNILHLAGRHIMASGLGFGNTVLLAANILDMIFLLSTAMIVVAAGFFAGIIKIPDLIISALSGRSYMTAVSVVILTGSALFLWFFITHRRRFSEFIRPGKIAELLSIQLLFLPGFVINTVILFIIYKYMLAVNVSVADIIYFFVAFTLAWAAGFIIPGAPGGIGIRESLILILFGGIYGENNTVFAAILMRLISVAGDAGVWAVSLFYEMYLQTGSNGEGPA